MEQSFVHPHCSTVLLLPDRCNTGPAIPGVASHESGDYRTLTNFLPDRCNTGLAIPGVVSHKSGDYRTMTLCSRLAGALSPGAPGMPISPTLAPTDTPQSHPNTSHIRLPDTPEPLSLHIHSQSRVHNMSGLSPYCCYTRLGCHHTAVLDVRAFTVLLFYT